VVGTDPDAGVNFCNAGASDKWTIEKLPVKGLQCGELPAALTRNPRANARIPTSPRRRGEVIGCTVTANRRLLLSADPFLDWFGYCRENRLVAPAHGPLPLCGGAAYAVTNFGSELGGSIAQNDRIQGFLPSGVRVSN
jgi:hypothetical protein